MQLIGYGEYRTIDGAEQHLFTRFLREDGSTFDLPVDQNQFQVLIEAATPVPAASRAAESGTAVSAQVTRARPVPPILEDDDGPMRMADVDEDVGDDEL